MSISDALKDILSHCELCPRRCGVDRLAGQIGYCKAGTGAEVYRYGLHNGEEPPISGQCGSGTVFFSRCTLRCVYCQNYPWSQKEKGERYTAEELSGILGRLSDHGAHNLNLVSPTPWLPVVRDALIPLKKSGSVPPVVYNTSGFERVETLEWFGDLVDVYLVDLRYSRAGSAAEGSDSSEYVKSARNAFLAMWRQVGELQCDEEGVATRGTICRILVLPGRASEAVENLRWLAENVGTDLALSVMSQYTPAFRAPDMPGWDRRVTASEYDLVCEEVERLGFSTGWIQSIVEDSIPDLVGFRMKPGHDQEGE